MPSTNEIENLDVKTYGEVNVVTANDALTTLIGKTLTVRSGAKVFVYSFTPEFLEWTCLCCNPACLASAVG